MQWLRFEKFIEARNRFRTSPCIYVQTDSKGRPTRVGKASKGLEARYRGGTGYALEAAMNGSGNLVFVAEVPEQLCEAVEQALIWVHRDDLVHNNQGKRSPPTKLIEIVHIGKKPGFTAL